MNSRIGSKARNCSTYDFAFTRIPKKKWIKNQRNKEILWGQHQQYNRGAFNKLVKRAGIRRITPNFIRHKFISDMCAKINANELTVSDVALMAGNSVQIIESHYLHFYGGTTNKIRRILELRNHAS